MKPEIIILSGLPASGKSTLAKEWVAEDPDDRVRINYDELRLARYGADWKFNWKEEQQMKTAALKIAEDALKAGLSVVVDNTNLTEKARQPWVDLGKRFGADVVQQEMSTHYQTCVMRDELRTGTARVGMAVIHRMALFHGFIDWDEFQDESIILVDIDGTVANGAHRQHHLLSKPKDWDAFFGSVERDTPIVPIVEMVQTLAALYNVIYLTGRPMDRGVGIKTEEWLAKHVTQPKMLFMRQGGDHRPDTEAKKEILDLIPLKKIAFALEDRTRVVKMYREQGITCLQVRDGDF